MLRKALTEVLRKRTGCCKALSESSESYEATSLRAISTSNACQSKKKKKKVSSMSQSAQDALNQPALVEGFAKVPPEPKFLGLAGAIPFLMLAPPIATGIPLMPANFVSSAATLQIGYGATIASFLGGIHWALAMANYGRGVQVSQQDNTERYIWSVMPCLLAWPAVTMQPGPGSFVAAVAITAAYVVDRSFARRALLPSWYMALRLPLTVAAVGGLTITCASSFLQHVPQKGAIETREEESEN